MAAAVHRLLEDETTRRLLAGNAAADAKVRFNLRHQVQAYLDWFSSILQTKAAPESRARRVY